MASIDTPPPFFNRAASLPPPFAEPDAATTDELSNNAEKLKRYYIQQRAKQMATPAAEEEEMGDNDWTITYTDMVTLMMAFFVFITAISYLENNKNVTTEQNPYARTSLDIPHVSPFDGAGFTPVEDGRPANRDKVVSRFDDPENNSRGTTDPTPSGEANTGLTEPPTGTASPLSQQLQQLVQDNQLGDAVEVLTGQQTVTLRISEKILFASGRSNLEAEGVALVQRLSSILAKADGMISVEGHTDNRPIKTAQFASNWELSAGRAAEVLRQLEGMGVPANRMRAVGYGETRPLSDNATADGRSTNRRVEIVITNQ